MVQYQNYIYTMEQYFTQCIKDIDVINGISMSNCMTHEAPQQTLPSRIDVPPTYVIKQAEIQKIICNELGGLFDGEVGVGSYQDGTEVLVCNSLFKFLDSYSSLNLYFRFQPFSCLLYSHPSNKTYLKTLNCEINLLQCSVVCALSVGTGVLPVPGFLLASSRPGSRLHLMAALLACRSKVPRRHSMACYRMKCRNRVWKKAGRTP